MDVDEALASSIEAKLRPRSPFSSRTCIFRVPQVLSGHGEGAFAPNIVSIGPFHHGHENLKSMEESKLWYLRSLLSRAPTPQTSLKIFTKAIGQLEERARECYGDQSIDLDTDEFVKMMLTDGCFILELFRRKANGIGGGQGDDPISRKPWMDTYLRGDLMLLENQIPWFVLECLFNLTEPPIQRSPSLAELVLGFFDTMMPMTVPAKSSSRLETKHLLDLLRNSIISVTADLEVSQVPLEVIPKVTDLVEAGVKFREGNPEEILNIRFEDGVMEIPPLQIQESTECLFRNLIAYEQCSCLMPSRITSYVFLLSSLIHSSEDVHLLRDQGILKKCLGIEEDGSLFFSRVLKGVILDGDHKFYYVGICQKMNAYYRTSYSGHKWLATLKRILFFEVSQVTLENEYRKVIPKVTDLVEAGVKFRMGNPGEILHIRFEDGVMEIPPLLIQESTECLFRNLIAYEQCSFSMPNRITSYVLLLNGLIHSSEDVQLLRDQGILVKCLSTEEDGSLFFSRVLKGVTLDKDHKFYY